MTPYGEWPLIQFFTKYHEGGQPKPKKIGRRNYLDGAIPRIHIQDEDEELKLGEY